MVLFSLLTVSSPDVPVIDSGLNWPSSDCRIASLGTTGPGSASEALKAARLDFMMLNVGLAPIA